MTTDEILDLEAMLDDLETTLDDLRRNLEFHSRVGNSETAEKLETEINELSASYEKMLEQMEKLEAQS